MCISWLPGSRPSIGRLRPWPSIYCRNVAVGYLGAFWNSPFIEKTKRQIFECWCTKLCTCLASYPAVKVDIHATTLFRQTHHLSGGQHQFGRQLLEMARSGCAGASSHRWLRKVWHDRGTWYEIRWRCRWMGQGEMGSWCRRELSRRSWRETQQHAELFCV